MTPATDDRLRALKRAHASTSTGPTPRVEDYIEVVYELILEKGYARIIDIGAHLSVSSPTVTKMLQRLHEEGFVVYERYRGVTLTAVGTDLAKIVRHRHGILTRFLRLLGVDDATAHRDTEGIEHHLDADTLEKITSFVAYADAHPDWWAQYARDRK